MKVQFVIRKCIASWWCCFIFSCLEVKHVQRQNMLSVCLLMFHFCHLLCRYNDDPKFVLRQIFWYSAAMDNSTQFTNLMKENSDQQNTARQRNDDFLQFLKLLNVANNVRNNIAMFLLPIGIVFNFISVATFLKIRIWKTSTGLHLVCLALSECLLLVGYAIPLPWPYRINNFHVSFCIIRNFIVSSQQTWNGLLMVSMTIERYISVAFPLKVKSWNLKGISKVLISFLGICSLIMGGLSGARRSVNSNKVPHQCRNNQNLVEITYVSNMFTYTVVGYGLAPVLTFLFTVLIAHQLHKQRKARKVMIQEGQSNNNKEFTITAMLFLVACLYLVSKIFFVVTWYVKTYPDRNSPHFRHASVGYSYARLLIFINHSMNSLVYIIFFKAFREAFVAILCFNRNCKIIGQRKQKDLGREQEMSSLPDEIPTVSSDVIRERHQSNTENKVNWSWLCVAVSSIRARYLVHTSCFFFIFCQKFGSDCASALYQWFTESNWVDVFNLLFTWFCVRGYSSSKYSMWCWWYCDLPELLVVRNILEKDTN